MAKRKTYQDLLSTFELSFERDGVELVQEQVSALDEDDANADALWLRGKHGIPLFDETVCCRVRRLDAPEEQ